MDFPYARWLPAFVLVCMVPGAFPQTASAGPRCHVPSGAVRVLASKSAHTTVYRRRATVSRGTVTRYWACTASSGVVRHLQDVGDYGAAGKTTLSRFTFAEPYVAALVTKSDGVGDTELDIVFYDLSGKLSRAASYLGESVGSGATIMQPRLLRLLVNSSGRLAWLQQTPNSQGAYNAGLRTMEYATRGQRVRHLDDGAADAITDLKLSGHHLSWKHTGVPRTATLAIVAS